MRTTLGAVTDNFDATRRPVKATEREDGPFPYYGASGVVDHVSDYLYDGEYLLIAEDGENLRSRNTPIAFLASGQFWVNNHAHVVRANHMADTRFLGHALAQTDISGYLSGSTLPKLTRRAMDSIVLDLPPLPTQRAIVEVLGALDDKIAVNQSVVTACDELRRANYEAAVGEASRPLSELARFVNGRAYTKSATGTGRVVVRIAELNSGLGGSTVYNDIEVPEDNLARPGDLLFAWSGSLTAARWYRPEAIVNQHIFKVIPNHDWPLWLVACAVDRKLEDFKAIAADKATTMGHIQRRHLDEPVGVPDPAAIAASDALMTTLWGRALAAEVESLHLADLRDTLLPHLMSGRITVRNAEQQVEGVL
ncbi:restriction endonuclease subunit S [Micropruina sp.]|uniref:restriction endonuclease subunit S n=1 Tax=Micropruina sp. TaxID=2737536 RepID=UPI0026291E31|nr:restriction endonuclease subunit S [Micropruina sp.]